MMDQRALDVETGHGTTNRGDPNVDPQSHFEQSQSGGAGLQLNASRKWSKIFVGLVLLLGIFASSLFLALGFKSNKKEHIQMFERRATSLTKNIENAWDEYQVAALWMYQSACGARTITRDGFSQLFEYLAASGLNFKAAGCARNITHEERPAAEEESRAYFQDYPSVNYQGFTGLEPDPDNAGELAILYREEMPFYFPVRLMEPLEGNEAGMDFDLYSHPARKATIDAAISTWKPTLTPRIRLVQETEPDAYSVILMHPGIPLNTAPDRKPRDLANLVVRIPSLLQRAIRNHQVEMAVYIFDSSAGAGDAFMGGARSGGTENLQYLEETDLSSVRDSKHIYEERISIASSEWTIVVVDEDEGLSGLTFVIVGAVVILATCAFTAFFIFTSMKRVAKISAMETEAEKAAASLRAERELNEFFAHEIRNPLSAAMSALSFVSTEVNTEPPLVDATSIASVRDDIHIIKNSHSFINDLLRTMLDMQRAASNRMKINKGPTDLTKDVFEPVGSMLYHRGLNYEVLYDCPANLMVLTDRLRLTQVVLNLARNSAKFVTAGFVRLRAQVVDNGTNVQLSVEDTGPGIPSEKRNTLFAKFQESLDSLNQGTGVGLCLSKSLVDLLGANLWLDETYDTGVAGCPGARFVISLNTAPLQLNEEVLDSYEAHPTYRLSASTTIASDNTFSQTDVAAAASVLDPQSQLDTLPTNISVLFVDDDVVLRKLFTRAVKRVRPDWDVHEASSGEAALALMDDSSQSFDLIFVDMYMASVEKQLLGTETVSALRAKGIESRICGLSANDLETAFINAGADFFELKPMATSKDELARKLEELLRGERRWTPK